MTHHPFNPKPTAVLGGLGGHIVLSLGIAIAIAGAVGLPKLSGYAGAASPLSTIVDRLDYGPVGEERMAPGVITPATFAMPMTAGWPELSEADFADAAPRAAASSAMIASAADRPGLSAKPAPLPPRRPPILAATKPMVLQPVVTASAVGRAEVPVAKADAPNASWRRYALMPVETVSGVVQGAAGSIHSAGSWTVAQAASLLPNWR